MKNQDANLLNKIGDFTEFVPKQESILDKINKCKHEFISKRNKEPTCLVLGEKEVEYLKERVKIDHNTREVSIKNGDRVMGMILLRTSNESFLKVGLMEEIGNVSYFRQ